jgi:hypothetical protein
VLVHYLCCCPPPLQELLERCLLLADKYDMACLMQRLAGHLTAPGAAYSTDPSTPNFALRCGSHQHSKSQVISIYIHSCQGAVLTESSRQGWSI